MHELIWLKKKEEIVVEGRYTLKFFMVFNFFPPHSFTAGAI